MPRLILTTFIMITAITVAIDADKQPNQSFTSPHPYRHLYHRCYFPAPHTLLGGTAAPLILFLFFFFFFFKFFLSQMHTPLKQRSGTVSDCSHSSTSYLPPPQLGLTALLQRPDVDLWHPCKVLFLFYVIAQFSSRPVSCFLSLSFPLFEASPCALNCSPFNPSGPLFCLSVLLFPPALSEISSEAVGLAALQLFGTSNSGAKHFSCQGGERSGIHRSCRAHASAL